MMMPDAVHEIFAFNKYCDRISARISGRDAWDIDFLQIDSTSEEEFPASVMSRQLSLTNRQDLKGKWMFLVKAACSSFAS